MQSHGYENRSEAIRDLARLGLKAKAMEAGGGRKDCVATFSYVFDRLARDLPKRLTAAHHAHHDLQVATLHVHLDHDRCLEVAILRGGYAEVRHLADAVTAERGVLHGALSVIPDAGREAKPSDKTESRHDGHGHRHPRS